MDVSELKECNLQTHDSCFPLGLWINFVEIVTGQSGEMQQITLLQPRAYNGL